MRDYCSGFAAGNKTQATLGSLPIGLNVPPQSLLRFDIEQSESPWFAAARRAMRFESPPYYGMQDSLGRVTCAAVVERDAHSHTHPGSIPWAGYTYGHSRPDRDCAVKI